MPSPELSSIMLTSLVLNVKLRDEESDLSRIKQGLQVDSVFAGDSFKLSPNSLPLLPSPYVPPPLPQTLPFPSWPKLCQNVPDGKKPYPAGLGVRKKTSQATDVNINVKDVYKQL